MPFDRALAEEKPFGDLRIAQPVPDEGEDLQLAGRKQSAQLVALPQGERLRPLGRHDTQALIALDTRAAGMPRDALIQQLLASGDTWRVGLLLHFYHGQIETEQVKILGRKTARLAELNPEYLLRIEVDWLYEFVPDLPE